METRTLTALVLVVLASGCIQPDTPGTSSGGSGLEIAEFRATDHTLNPGQETRVKLLLRNHHPHQVDFEDVSLYNTGFLTLDQKSWEERCTSTSLQGAREGFTPEMECTWTVTAPQEDSGFESRGINIDLNLAYRSTISNSQQPFKVSFKEMSEINNRQELSHTFSNSEVEMTISTENPAPQDGSILDVQLAPAGNGRVASDYSLSYSPESVFPGCDTEVEPVAGETTRFSCEIVPGTSGTATRNLVIATSYKYVKSPSLDIEVVKP